MTEQAIADTDKGTGERASALEHMASRHRVAAAEARALFSAALRVAFGRMGADCPGLEAIVQDVRIRQASLAEIIDMAEPGMFLSLLEGQGERMGLLMASSSLLAGMVEAQTTGAVATTQAPVRKPTRTDAALIAPMIDAFLRLAEQRCAGLPEAAQVSGFVYGSFLDDPRPLGLVLEDGAYVIHHLHVALGFGARQGDWILILPIADSTDRNPLAQSEAEQEAKDWAARLEATITASPVQIDAVLCRVQVSLTEAVRLRPGDVLRLPEAALEALSVETIGHAALGIGRLGQARGQRAVRLTADPGVLTDAMGVSVSPLAIPASILPFRPPQAAFVPEGHDGIKATPVSSEPSPRDNEHRL